MEALSDFARNNHYSQNGEDGIVDEILERLKKHVQLDFWCCEFGAWDGVYLSNTCYFIREKNYRAILIEGNSKKVHQLNKNFPDDKIIKENRLVAFEGENSLEMIFSEHKMPVNFDFLSIDVDGVDYHIFDSLKAYRPKVICIEFNPCMPNDCCYVNPKSMGVKHGSSAKALTHLAKLKEYELVACTNCNLIFVAKDLARFVTEKEQSLKELNAQGNDPIYVFSGYDGSILSNKEEIHLGWHGVPVPISTKLQYLPKFLRVFEGDYSLVQRISLILWVGVTMPTLVIRKRDKALRRLINEVKKMKSFMRNT